MGFDTSALQKLAVELGEADARVTDRVSAAIRKTALDIEADAKALAPVDTGALKNSISSDIKPLSAEIGPSTSYAHFVEHGTSRMAAQPYMGPAFERRVPGLEKAIGQIGGKIL